MPAPFYINAEIRIDKIVKRTPTPEEVAEFEQQLRGVLDGLGYIYELDVCGGETFKSNPVE